MISLLKQPAKIVGYSEIRNSELKVVDKVVAESYRLTKVFFLWFIVFNHKELKMFARVVSWTNKWKC